MKRGIVILLFLLVEISLFSQTRLRDSLKQRLASVQNDSAKVAILNMLFYEYLYSYPDSSLNYVQQEILLAKRTNSDLALSKAYIDYTSFFATTGNYPEALRFSLEALKLAEKLKNWLIIARVYN